MADQILKRLIELKDGQDRLRRELLQSQDQLRREVLGAIGESNQSVMSGRVEELERRAG